MIRILLDSCVWGGVLGALRDLGWDVEWVADPGPDPGDTAILARALAEDRILVTLDKDFGELVHLRGLAHPGIVRFTPCLPTAQSACIAAVIEAHAADLRKGAMVVVTRSRVRVRLPAR